MLINPGRKARCLFSLGDQEDNFLSTSLADYSSAGQSGAVASSLLLPPQLRLVLLRQAASAWGKVVIAPAPAPAPAPTYVHIPA